MNRTDQGFSSLDSKTVPDTQGRWALQPYSGHDALLVARALEAWNSSAGPVCIETSSEAE